MLSFSSLYSQDIFKIQVVFKITLYRVPFTILYISEEHLVLSDKQHYSYLNIEPVECCDISIEDESKAKEGILRYKTNALFLQPFVKCLSSAAYRTLVIGYLKKLSGFPECGTALVKLKLEPPDQELIDYAWNDRMLRLLWTRLEIENAFSWLSTLGGAYSALGDYFPHCAEEAGRISVRQYRLSKMLGDESLAARSKLYSALAHSQKGRLHTSRQIVRNINNYAIETKDRRLNRMCQGVWAKLKYLRGLRNDSDMSPQGDWKMTNV